MPPVRFSTTPNQQRGSGLLEVLISVLILGIGMLGIAAMQTIALRNSQSSMERSQAVVQTYSIMDAMRANRTQALAGNYNTAAATCAAPAAAATLASKDMNQWITSLKATLGVAGDITTCGSVSCAADGQCLITVQWDDQRATDGSATGTGTAAGATTYTVTTRTRL